MSGLLGSSARPGGTVTFLFTDIEGSTRRWEAYTIASINMAMSMAHAIEYAWSSHLLINCQSATENRGHAKVPRSPFLSSVAMWPKGL